VNGKMFLCHGGGGGGGGTPCLKDSKPFIDQEAVG
jgi:hypothetical protein